MKHTLITSFAFACALLIGAHSVLADDTPPANPAPDTSVTAPQVTLPAMATLPPVADPDAGKDKVVESMNRAMEAYQAGKYKEALKLSNDAENGIRNKHAEFYRAMLPPAPGGGWEADDKTDSSATLGAQMIGGMSLVSRNYNGGGHTATIAYMVDSPMMTMVSGLMQVVSSVSGPNSSSEDVKGYRAIYREQDANHQGAAHQLMVFAGDVIVIVQSETLPKETLLQFANLVDYDKFKTVD